jgi:uncharacterized membrane protein
VEEVINLSKVKFLGGIGSIILFLAFTFPFSLWMLLNNLVGFVLVAMAIFNLEKETKSNGITAKFIIGSLISLGVILLIFLFIFFGLITLSFIKTKKIWLTIFVGGMLLIWVLFILGNYLIKKSYDKIAQITKEKKFAMAGLFYLVGAITSTTFFIGIFFYFLSRIFQVLAFFSLPNELKRE